MVSRLGAALAGAALLALASPAVAQQGGAAGAPISSALAQRTHELLTVLNGHGRVAAIFSRSFLAEVPEPQLRAAAAAVAAQLGRAKAIVSVTPLDNRRARLVIAYEKGQAGALLVVAPGPQGQITGLLLDSVEPADIAALATLDDVADAVAGLPGEAAFLAIDLFGDWAKARRPDKPLAVASAHKLAILAELVRAIDAGERRWSDTVPLGMRELPAGGFNRQPAGSSIDLRTLATEMIRVSDNSATDLLLHHLGRERVEAMLEPLGWQHAGRNRPFLSTMELFKLKWIGDGALGRRYAAADLAERRRLLAQEVARQPGSAIAARERPAMIDTLEWFASPMDLARTMGWFVAHADTPAGAEALRILALNPGPASAQRERFAYAGYKGGSEPGVINMTMLVRTRAGDWTVVTATWNDPANAVDEARFGALVTRALTLLAD